MFMPFFLSASYPAEIVVSIQRNLLRQRKATLKGDPPWATGTYVVLFKTQASTGTSDKDIKRWKTLSESLKRSHAVC